MTYDPTISAARRAAKQIARDTGSSYQSSLDAVARRAGRPDWDAYLASPAELPTEGDFYINGEEHRHNQKAVFMTGAATLPGMSTLPFIVTQGRETTLWGLLQIMGFALGFWMCATLGALMFFDMLAVHPDAPEVGEKGTRTRHTSKELAGYAIGMSVGMLVLGYFTRNADRANFPLVMVTAGLSIGIGAAALALKAGMGRRILSLIAFNGTIVAGLATAAMMPK